MNLWAARSPDGTRIRLQLEPLDRPWPGWEKRAGAVADADYRRLCESTDDAEIEALHLSLWQQLSPID